MKVKMVHNDEVREHPDHLAQRLIEAHKAVEIIEITPAVEQLSALGIKPETVEVGPPPTFGGYDVRPGETMEESCKRHGIEPVSEQPSAD
jgi:hypothetical protein